MQLHPSHVLKTHQLSSGTIWRRRKVVGTNYSYTTYETPTLANITVVKKSGKKEKFDHYKLFGSIYISFADEKGKGVKHAVKGAKEVLNHLIHQVLLEQQSEIGTQSIAKQTIKIIKSVDYYAGMRYASRYGR